MFHKNGFPEENETHASQRAHSGDNEFGIWIGQNLAEKDWDWIVEELTEIDHDLTSDIAQMEPDWDEWAAETKHERSHKHHWFFIFET